MVRVCEPTYKIEELKTEGIEVKDLAYDDGTSPPTEVSVKNEFLQRKCLMSLHMKQPLLYLGTIFLVVDALKFLN